jgi:hypothetical protein
MRVFPTTTRQEVHARSSSQTCEICAGRRLASWNWRALTAAVFRRIHHMLALAIATAPDHALRPYECRTGPD